VEIVVLYCSFCCANFFYFFFHFLVQALQLFYQGFLYLFLYLSYLLISFTTAGLFFNKYKALRHKSSYYSHNSYSRYKAPQHYFFFIFRYKAPQHNLVILVQVQGSPAQLFHLSSGIRLPSTHFFLIFVLMTTTMST